MTKREAALILGISPTAPSSKVKDQYRKLIKYNHPDLGGSSYISQKISEAYGFFKKMNDFLTWRDSVCHVFNYSASQCCACCVATRSFVILWPTHWNQSGNIQGYS